MHIRNSVNISWVDDQPDVRMTAVPLFGEIREIVHRIQAGLEKNYQPSDLVFGCLGRFRKRIVSAICAGSVECWTKLFVNGEPCMRVQGAKKRQSNKQKHRLCLVIRLAQVGKWMMNVHMNVMSRRLSIATSLVDHSDSAIRLTAKNILLEAYLASAKVIARGNWTGKEEAVNKWINRAMALARDPNY